MIEPGGAIIPNGVGAKGAEFLDSGRRAFFAGADLLEAAGVDDMAVRPEAEGSRCGSADVRGVVGSIDGSEMAGEDESAGGRGSSGGIREADDALHVEQFSGSSVYGSAQFVKTAPKKKSLTIAGYLI